MSTNRPSRFLTIKDVAADLATSESQIRSLIASGEIPAIQIGGRGQWRIERTRLEEYIANAYARTAEAIHRGAKSAEVDHSENAG